MGANDTEGRKPQGSRGNGWALGLIVGGALLALLTADKGVSMWVEASWLEANGLQAEGDVIGMDTDLRLVSHTPEFLLYSSYYSVSYSFVDQLGQLIDGQTRIVEAEFLSSYPGQSLTVVYAPSDPTWNRRLKRSHPEVYAKHLVMGGAGALAALIGLVWWRAGRRGQAAQRRHDDGGPILRRWAAFGAAAGLAVGLARLTDWFATPLPPFAPLPHLVGNLVTLVTYAAAGAFLLVAMRLAYALVLERRRG